MDNRTEFLLGRGYVGLENRIRLQDPLLLTDPEITGTAEDGETLTAAIGTYRDGAVVTGETFQWFLGALPIEGEDTDELVLTTAMVGQFVKCRIRVKYGLTWYSWFTDPVEVEA